MTKVYELVGMDACKMQITYCGTKINLEFKNGNFLNGKRASLVTSNQFVQDAIENDSKFGNMIKLVAIHGQKSESEEKRPRTIRRGKTMKTQAEIDAEKGNSTEGESKVVGDGDKIVEEIKTINDAIDYFVSLGETVENEEQIQELMDKHKVKFPNMK